jgi:Endonuclease/Exonuclease/phosphatase family
VRAVRAVDGLAWAVAGSAAAVMLTQAARRTPTPLAAVGQALTPGLACAAIPATIVGIARNRPALALIGAASAVGLARVVRPAMRAAPTQRPARSEAFTIAHANMLFTNRRHARDAVVSVLATEADVLALSEVTSRHVLAFKMLDLDERYPHRITKAARDSHGLAVWSKLPLDGVSVEPMIRRPGLVANVGAPSGVVRIVLAHPDPPMKWRWLKVWEPSLRRIDAVGSSPGPPTVVVADLNAARWHPPFRRLLDGRWRDAHEQVGRGMSASWPTLGLFPRFVRLDHALVDESLDVLDVVDFKVPGSDHRGFVVSIAPHHARRATAE